MSDRQERVRLALRHLNVSQQDVAAVAGVSQSLNRALSGEQRVRRCSARRRPHAHVQEATNFLPTSPPSRGLFLLWVVGLSRVHRRDRGAGARAPEHFLLRLGFRSPLLRFIAPGAWSVERDSRAPDGARPLDVRDASRRANQRHHLLLAMVTMAVWPF